MCFYPKPLGDQMSVACRDYMQTAKMMSALAYGYHYPWMLEWAAGRMYRLAAFGGHRTAWRWCLPQAHMGHTG